MKAVGDEVATCRQTMLNKAVNEVALERKSMKIALPEDMSEYREKLVNSVKDWKSAQDTAMGEQFDQRLQKTRGVEKELEARPQKIQQREHAITQRERQLQSMLLALLRFRLLFAYSLTR